MHRSLPLEPLKPNNQKTAAFISLFSATSKAQIIYSRLLASQKTKQTSQYKQLDKKKLYLNAASSTHKSFEKTKLK